MRQVLFNIALVMLPLSVAVGFTLFLLFLCNFVSSEAAGRALAACCVAAVLAAVFIALHPHL